MRIVLLPLFLLGSIAMSAQRTAEAGLFLGGANYQGDFAKTPVSFNETGPVAGIMYQRFLAPLWGVRASVTFGQISGSDANLGESVQRYRNWSFRANVFEAAGHMQFHPWGRARYDQVGNFQSHLSPYVSLGLGLTFANARVSAPAEDKLKLPEPDDRNVFLAVPVSAGIRYVMTEKLTLAAEFGQRAVFSDFIDGVSTFGNPDGKDWYMFFGFGLTYTLMAEY